MKERLVQLIDLVTSKHRRFKELEELTSVSSDSWRMFYSGKQRATEEMIEKICSAFPKVALWLTTGKSLPEHEQYDARTFSLLKIYRLASIIEKEPIELTEDEMQVLSAEQERIFYIYTNIDFANFYSHEIIKIQQTRNLGITRNEFSRRQAEEISKMIGDNVANSKLKNT